MKKKTEEFKILKQNPGNNDTNYIFQNDKITRIGFYIVATTLIVGITMVIVSGILI